MPHTNATTAMWSKTESPKLWLKRCTLTTRLVAHERDMVEARLAHGAEQGHDLAVGDALVGAHVHHLVGILVRQRLEPARQVGHRHHVAADVVLALLIHGH